MPSPSSPKVLPEVFGPYRIVRRLGKGGMGTVYLARDTRLERNVALKICHLTEHPQALDRFRQEAKAAASLSHPNLCPVHEFDVRDGIAYLTMAFIDGPTLQESLRLRGPLPPREAALLVAKLALAMQAAHDGGVVHRDLKPANVALNRKGEPVILDFGLARQASAAGPRLTQLGMFIGTPAYTAPEQVDDTLGAVGPACDVYSLGVIFYELLTGDVPFKGALSVVLNKVVHVAPEPPSRRSPALDPRLDAVCLKALAKQPGERFPSMADFADALADPVRTRSTVSPEQPPKSETNKPAPVVATLLGVAAPKDEASSVEATFPTLPLPSGLALPSSLTAPAPAVILPSNAALDPFRSVSARVPTTTTSAPPGTRWGMVALVIGLALLPVGLVGWQLFRSRPPRETAAAIPDTSAKPPTKSEMQPLPLDPERTRRPTAVFPPIVPAAFKASLPRGPVPRPAAIFPEFFNAAGMRMVFLAPGRFRMGSPESEHKRDVKKDETAHRVALTHGFYMGATLVTQRQWQAVMGRDDNPSTFKGEDLPVDSVSWDEARSFCARLSALEGRHYRLPSEAEWEYACRAGTTTPFWCGETIATTQANFNGNQPYRTTEAEGEYRKQTTPATRFPANPWKLHDMHGNLYQWCEDRYGDYPKMDVDNPTGAVAGGTRVLRGGAWNKYVWDCRAASREDDAPGNAHKSYGFRVVLSLGGEADPP